MNPYREELEARVDREIILDTLWEEMTDMQAAVCHLISCGWTQSEVARHFEVSKQNISQILDVVRGKLLRIEWQLENDKLQ